MTRMTMVLSSLVVCVLLLSNVEAQIWKTYKKTILNSAEAMINLLKCINDLSDCSPVQEQVKEVFRSYFTRDCSDCCKKRKKMVREMMAYWQKNGMVNEDEMRHHFDSPIQL